MERAVRASSLGGPGAFRVKCSCGKETVVTVSGETYSAAGPGWRFRTLAEAEEFEQRTWRYIHVGWYCGEEGHEQGEYRPL